MFPKWRLENHERWGLWEPGEETEEALSLQEDDDNEDED